MSKLHSPGAEKYFLYSRQNIAIAISGGLIAIPGLLAVGLGASESMPAQDRLATSKHDCDWGLSEACQQIPSQLSEVEAGYAIGLEGLKMMAIAGAVVAVSYKRDKVMQSATSVHIPLDDEVRLFYQGEIVQAEYINPEPQMSFLAD